MDDMIHAIRAAMHRAPRILEHVVVPPQHTKPGTITEERWTDHTTGLDASAPTPRQRMAIATNDRDDPLSPSSMDNNVQSSPVQSCRESAASGTEAPPTVPIHPAPRTPSLDLDHPHLIPSLSRPPNGDPRNPRTSRRALDRPAARSSPCQNPER